MNRKDLPKANAVCETCGSAYYKCPKCIKLRNGGVDNWRYHCDCPECYAVYTSVVLVENGKVENVKDELANIAAVKLPEGKKISKEMRSRINAISKANDSESSKDKM